MNKFWRLNKIKILWVGSLIFILLLVVMIFLSMLDGRMDGVVIVPVIISVLFAIGYSIRGITYYKIIARIVNDESEKSIIPLFDSGFSIEYTDEKSKIELTKENLMGTILGFPVSVSFYQADRASWSSLSFSFYPLSKAGFGNEVARFVSFNMNLRNRLKKDIKPDVLKFVAGLKEKGYTPAK